MSKYGVTFGPYFPVFRLNTGIYSVSLLFSPNTRNYSPKLRVLALFTQGRTILLDITQKHIVLNQVLSSSRSSTLPKIKLDLQFLINNFCFQQVFPNHRYSESGPLFDYVFLFQCEFKSLNSKSLPIMTAMNLKQTLKKDLLLN